MSPQPRRPDPFRARRPTVNGPRGARCPRPPGPGMASPSDATRAVTSAATAATVEALPVDPLKGKIQALKDQQETLRRQKKQLRAQIRNAQRQQSRLAKRARQMTDEDLVAVLLMRKSKREERLTLAAGRQDDAPEENGPASAGKPTGRVPRIRERAKGEGPRDVEPLADTEERSDSPGPKQ